MFVPFQWKKKDARGWESLGISLDLPTGETIQYFEGQSFTGGGAPSKKQQMICRTCDEMLAYKPHVYVLLDDEEGAVLRYHLDCLPKEYLDQIVIAYH